MLRGIWVDYWWKVVSIILVIFYYIQRYLFRFLSLLFDKVIIYIWWWVFTIWFVNLPTYITDLTSRVIFMLKWWTYDSMESAFIFDIYWCVLFTRNDIKHFKWSLLICFCSWIFYFLCVHIFCELKKNYYLENAWNHINKQ